MVCKAKSQEGCPPNPGPPKGRKYRDCGDNCPLKVEIDCTYWQHPISMTIYRGVQNGAGNPVGSDITSFTDPAYAAANFLGISMDAVETSNCGPTQVHLNSCMKVVVDLAEGSVIDANAVGDPFNPIYLAPVVDAATGGLSATVFALTTDPAAAIATVCGLCGGDYHRNQVACPPEANAPSQDTDYEPSQTLCAPSKVWAQFSSKIKSCS